jgi:predicted TIM-barrel fold metal-dependent hydrolase
MRPPYPIVDVHVHITSWENVRPDVAASVRDGIPDFERIQSMLTDPGRLVAFMDEQAIEKLVMINFVSPEVFGYTEEVNTFASNMARRAPDRLIPFGGIDPRRVPDVAAEMDHLFGDLGIRGIKLHPPHQYFHVNDYRDDASLRGLATIYEKCIEYGAPLMVHTGTSIFPRARNKYGDPIDIDDVIVDFPDLKVIVAHGGRPLWMDTALFLLRRSRNVYLDVSSIPPKRLLEYFPWIEKVADRAMFGSDWPGPMVLDLGRNVEDFYSLPISEEAKRKILRETALELLA